MHLIGVQAGYKQFFGGKKTWGARDYGFLDDNHAYIKFSFFNPASDVFPYGVGAGALYNFTNDKATQNNKISFGGIAIASAPWLNAQSMHSAAFNHFYNAKWMRRIFRFYPTRA
ncbi:outer membrane beta-barrel protein [Helicobacter acinonychis]|uniref:OMP1126 n=1 Tax=Helicobacter acinonychis TaxID=212 RepID=A0A1M4NFQ2_HELAC|nr:OMP1126 [Helicobacter acinonychis]